VPKLYKSRTPEYWSNFIEKLIGATEVLVDREGNKTDVCDERLVNLWNENEIYIPPKKKRKAPEKLINLKI
jgi:hypothetical protein